MSIMHNFDRLQKLNEDNDFLNNTLKDITEYLAIIKKFH